MRTISVTQETRVETVWAGEVPGIPLQYYVLKLSALRKKPVVLAFDSKQSITKMAQVLDALLLEAQENAEGMWADDSLAKQLSFWEDLPYVEDKVV